MHRSNVATNGWAIAAKARGALILCATVWIGSWLLPQVTADPQILRYAPVARLLALGVAGVQLLTVLVFEGLLHQRAGVRSPRVARDLVALCAHLTVAALILKAMVGLEVGPLITTSALVGAVVGLALQETLGTVFAGVTLAGERRVLPGMWIEVDDLLGEVEELSWRAVVLKTTRGHRVLLPNAELVGSRITLVGDGTTPSAVSARVALPRAVEPAAVKATLERVAADLADVEASPAVRVYVREVGGDDEGVVYEALLWTTKPWLRGTIADQFLTRGHAALRRELGVFADAGPAASGPATAEDLHRAPIFNALPDDALQELAAASRRLRFASGEAVVRQGDASRTIYVIAEGEASVERDGVERSQLPAGEVFGEIAFLTGEPRSATVRASGVLDVIAIDDRALAAMLSGREDLVALLADRMTTYRRRDAEALVTDPETSEHVTWIEFARRRLSRLMKRAWHTKRSGINRRRDEEPWA